MPHDLHGIFLACIAIDHPFHYALSPFAQFLLRLEQLFKALLGLALAAEHVLKIRCARFRVSFDLHGLASLGAVADVEVGGLELQANAETVRTNLLWVHARVLFNYYGWAASQQVYKTGSLILWFTIETTDS